MNLDTDDGRASGGEPNGVHTNGIESQDLPVTKLLAAFVASATTKHLTPPLREKIKEVLIDYVGVVVGALDNADSSGPIYQAVLNLQGGPVPASARSCTVLAKGEPHFLPQYAALVNAAFGHSMDFDDTHAAGTLHAGVTAISAALATFETLVQHGTQPTADEFMLAVSVGYEVTCRLGQELGFDAYTRGFHNTSTAGIFGSVATIAVLRHLSAEQVEMAFGLAGSKAAGSMQYLDNGSWNKRLHPGFAVHDAFMCISLAEAGVIGATRILEGKMGFLQAYSPSDKKDMKRLVAGLGQQWVWEASSLKPYPACRMTHAFIESCGEVHTSHAGKLKPEDVTHIMLIMSPSNFLLVGDPVPNKVHPSNVIDAQFSAYFQVANALLYGSATGLQAYQKLQDPGIRDLCSKIRAETDPSMSGFAAKMSIRWANGKTEQVQQQYPLGETQNPFTRDKVDEKFMSLAGPVYGERKARSIIETVDCLDTGGAGVLGLIEMLRQPQPGID